MSGPTIKVLLIPVVLGACAGFCPHVFAEWLHSAKTLLVGLLAVAIVWIAMIDDPFTLFGRSAKKASRAPGPSERWRNKPHRAIPKDPYKAAQWIIDCDPGALFVS